MYHVKTMNKISKIGLAELDDRFEISDTMEHEDAILVRSAKLHDYDFPAELLCIARAGAGVNNIPLDRAAEAGIVVFNTPGANANGVKELTIAALLLASRKISQGITWVKEQAAAGDPGQNPGCGGPGGHRRAGGQRRRRPGHADCGL